MTKNPCGASFAGIFYATKILDPRKGGILASAAHSNNL